MPRNAAKAAFRAAGESRWIERSRKTVSEPRRKAWRKDILQRMFSSLQFRFEQNFKIELKSLILAQIERWRHALHMQVER
jgi:hypothetical protein